jgi:pseudouridine synthase
VKPAPQATRVIAYHKPRGLITTHADELGRETVYDRLRSLLHASLARVEWHAIGRLDADTTGLLLFTNDGALVSHATQPTTKVPKTYEALCARLLDEASLDRLRHGVPLSGGLGTSAPCTVELLAYGINTTRLRLVLTEGRNRQVRRMLLAIGSQVIRLARTAVGNIMLDIEENAWRLLGDDEIRAGLGYEPRQLTRR